MHNNYIETSEERKHRRYDTFRIDWSLNINSLIGLLALLATIWNFGTKAVDYLKSIDAKTNIMWSHFDKNVLSKEEIEQLAGQR